MLSADGDNSYGMVDREIPTKHLGADLDPEFVQAFTDTVKSRDMKVKKVLRRLAEWFMKLPADVQEDFYHGKEPVPSGDKLREAVFAMLKEYEARRGARKDRRGPRQQEPR